MQTLRHNLKAPLVFVLLLVTGLGFAQGWVTTQRSFELKAQLPVDPPSACQTDDSHEPDACKSTLAGTHSSLPLVNVSVAAVGTAAQGLGLAAILCLIGALSFAQRRLQRWSLATLSVAAALAFMGTALYGTVSIFLGADCGMCQFMHGFNALLVGLTLVLYAVFTEVRFKKKSDWLPVVSVALIAWLAVALLIESRFRSTYNDIAQTFQTVSPIYNELFAQCQNKQCVDAMNLDPALMPSDTESIVLSDTQGPVLVEMLDMACPDCATNHRDFLSHWYRALLVEGRVGLRLVLYSSGRSCNEATTRMVPTSCEANNAIICAFEHAPQGKGAEMVLKYMDTEFKLPTRQSEFPGGRSRWLSEHVSEAAAHCFVEKVGLGVDGPLRHHLQYARRLASSVGTKPECQGKNKAWWCFKETPSFAVFRKPPPRQSQSDPSRIQEVGQAKGRQRLLNLRDCLLQ